MPFGHITSFLKSWRRFWSWACQSERSPGQSSRPGAPTPLLNESIIFKNCKILLKRFLVSESRFEFWNVTGEASWKSLVKYSQAGIQTMQQKLAVVSVLLLLLMAGVSTVMVAAHAFSQSSSSIPPDQMLQNPTPGNVTSGTATTTTITTTITMTTSTNSTSTSTANGGSLLVANPQSSGQTHYSDDDGGNSTARHKSGDD